MAETNSGLDDVGDLQRRVPELVEDAQPQRRESGPPTAAQLDRLCDAIIDIANILKDPSRCICYHSVAPSAINGPGRARSQRSRSADGPSSTQRRQTSSKSSIRDGPVNEVSNSDGVTEIPAMEDDQVESYRRSLCVRNVSTYLC